ncbi:hypothetical protein OGZ44_08500 [Lactococcus lactis]|uniref:hypothetical protein n=1 Tax=Lactococcus lactis TaxID=1358 RepID=UPI002417F002|nr:hypothetical protein [Lactococcus lactis]MDG4974284.1 hypothetical protein [Lactococcus lactis]
MNDFNQDMQNLLNAYDSNWEDYLILREQFIEKYSLSVEKLQEQLNTAKKALTEIKNAEYHFAEGYNYDSDVIFINGQEYSPDKFQEIAHDALAAIGGVDLVKVVEG